MARSAGRLPLTKIEPHPRWLRNFRHGPPAEVWLAQCRARQAPIDAAEHAEHMLHAKLLAEGMERWMHGVLTNRRRELVRVLARYAERGQARG